MRHFIASLLISASASTALAQEADPPTPAPEMEVTSVPANSAVAEARVLPPVKGIVTPENELKITVPTETLMALRDAPSDQAFLVASATIDGVPVNFQYSRDNLPDEIGLEATLPLSVDLGTPQVAIIGNTAGNDPREVPVTTRIYDARQAPFECEPGKTCIWRGEAKACHESVVVAPPPPMWAAEVDTSMYPAAHFGVHSLAASSCCDDWIFERSGTGRIFSVSVAAPYYVQQQPPMNPGCPGGGGD